SIAGAMLAPAGPGLAGDGATMAVGDVSRALAGDFRRDRPARLARLLARAALKRSLAAQAGRKHEEIGQLASLLASATEQADTRSWHLLPGTIEVVRLRVPAGTRPLTASVGGRVVPLGEVSVRAGAITFVGTRVWAEDAAVVAPRGTI
ncbi:MAG TPA: hypothetical protein VEZ47_05215, partial [Gemmatirosa sp.]|nr:hypothetical protein [Gemmatirosa sp.]